MNEMIILLGALLLAALGGVVWLLRENSALKAQSQDLSADLARISERARMLDESRTVMAEQFQHLSQQALQQSTEGLLKRAEESFVARERLALERVTHTLQPVTETLTKVEAQVKQMEEARLKDTGGLRAEIASLMQASHATREVTLRLANSLKRGAGVQGRWGEEVLRNVLQAAGLSARFDFVEQQSLDTEDGRRRPDVVVKLPGDKSSAVFVIDSKVNLSAYLEAGDAADDVAREAALRRHAQALRNHVRDLSAKAYWDQFRDQTSPDFVAMFIPGDGLLAAALEYVPELMTEAMDKKVIIVTPTTLFALCKAVAYGWRVEDQMKNANHIADLGRELYARLSVMGGHVSDVGTALGRAVDKYNAFVGSLESKVLTQARRFEELQVSHEGKSIDEVREVDSRPREQTKLSLTSSDESLI